MPLEGLSSKLASPTNSPGNKETSMANRLEGKRALITAAGQGMGRAAVLAFVREGASVIATDIDAGTLAGFAANKAIATSRLDVTDEDAVREFVEKAGAVD